MVTAAAVLATISVTATTESPAAAAERERAEILQEFRDAATPGATSAPTPTEHVEGPGKSEDAPGQNKDRGKHLGQAKVRPGEASTLTLDDVGAVEFSGHELAGELSLTGTSLPDVAAPLAESRGLTVLGTPFEVVATDSSGKDVSQFPALPTIAKDDDGRPYVTDVTPGVWFELPLDKAAVKGLSVGSIRVLTRETDADAWVELPSYYDVDDEVVYAESTHLSQFAVIGTAQDPAPKPHVVLDADDDIGHTDSPSGPTTELPWNARLASEVAELLRTQCNAEVTLTRPDASVRFLSTRIRAGIAAAANPNMFATLAFDAWKGHAWGSANDGGTKVFPRTGGDNDLAKRLVDTLPGWTTRPAKQTGSPSYPYSAFDSLPGTVVHMETLFIDHNYDRAVMEAGFTQAVTGGVFTVFADYLVANGFDCTDPSDGGWPKKPSIADLQRWRTLGYQNFQTYGADPVAFSTGNLIESEPLFTLPGAGGQVTDVSLVYNSQDGRESRVGTGWSFGFGTRAQRFEDGSVLIVRGDGASEVFEPDGTGFVAGDPANTQTLTDIGGGRLEVRDPSGESWIFDAADIDGIGELVSHTTTAGQTTLLAYGIPDADDRFVPLTQITDASGQTIQVGADAAGRVGSFTAPDGRVWKLGYNDSGDLVTISLPDGRTRSFTYDDAHRMLTATDAAGIQYLVNEYDDQGRVAKQWDADGNLRTFEYGDGVTSYTDAEGNVTEYAFDDRSRITKITDAAGGVKTFAYDENDNVTRAVENGTAWEYEYDTAGDLVRSVNPDGTVVTATYTAERQVASVTDQGGVGGADRTTRFGYDEAGFLTTQTGPDGAVTRYGYDEFGNLVSSTDPLGRETRYAYDTHGNLVQVTDAAGNVTRQQFNAAGLVTALSDPKGNTTQYVYDAAMRLVQVTDAVGAVASFAYDANDRLTATTDASGATTRYAWDALLRLVSVTDGNGHTTRYAYNREDTMVSVTDPLGAVTTYELDDIYRPTAVVDPNGGRWLREYDKAGNVSATTTPTGATTEFDYDPLGRVVSEKNPLGAVSKISYDKVGRVVELTDADGNRTSAVWDVNDALVGTVDALGHASTFTYDKAGQLTASTDRMGATTAFEYDKIGQLVQETDPLGATTKYTYDEAGNVTAVTDPLSRVTSFEYDAVGQLVGTTEPGGAHSINAYDLDGRLTQATDANGAVTTFEYDPAGQLVKSVDAAGQPTAYGYDAAGRQTSVVDAKGVKTGYVFDPAGQLLQVIQNAQPDGPVDAATNVTTAYGYTESGELASIVDANGNETTFGYDQAGQLTRETNALGKVWTYAYTPAGLLSSEQLPTGVTSAYHYDAVGNLTAVSRTDEPDVAFEYDREQRPISMTDGTGVTGWKYDPLGQVTEQVDATTHRLAYSYDLSGAITGMTLPDGTQVGYTYDAAGRPAQQSTPFGTWDYSWDAVGQLTKLARSNNVTSDIGYDPVGQVDKITHTFPTVGEPEAPTAGGSGDKGKKDAPAWGLDKKCEVPDPDNPAAKNGATGNGQGKAQCITGTDYLNKRGKKPARPAAGQGGTLTYDYSYDPVGNLSHASRTIAGVQVSTHPNGKLTPAHTAPIPEQVTRDYTYDPLRRLTGSTTQVADAPDVPPGQAKKSEQIPTGTAAYGYDAVGNRVMSTTVADGVTTQTQAVFNQANQLVATATTTDGEQTGEATYGYDAAGNRSTQTVDGVATQFEYNSAGQVTKLATPGRETTYRYDGLGRATTQTDRTHPGNVQDQAAAISWKESTTTTVWDGLQPVAQETDSGASTLLLRDQLGELALQHVDTTAPGNSGPAAGDTWALLDRLGSTVALSGDTGLLDELTDYSDWGQQTFETPGWNTQVGYTGELADANWGYNQYYARHYDPSTGSWLSQDPYRGQLTAPQTLQRYQFVENNPTTNQDLLGYSVDRGQTAVKAANTGNGGTKASKAGVKNAAGASRPTARHPDFGPIKTVLEAISFGLGILGFIPGPQQPVLLALSSILGGVSAFLGCLETGINADCLINVAFALLPGPIFKLAKPFKATVAKVFRDTFAQFKNLFKKPPKPQIKPKQSKPSPATSCTTRNSFTGDTVVLMADGTSKSIKNVQLGDKVIATDPETGQQGARVVTALIRHGGDHDMVKITTGAGTVIHATDQHPFWDTIDQEWVDAEDLTTTDVLVTAGGTEVHVASVSTYVEDVVAYNLTVDDLHTYHVSDADILVHNCPKEETRPFGNGGYRAERAPSYRATDEGTFKTREAAWEQVLRDKYKHEGSRPRQECSPTKCHVHLDIYNNKGQLLQTKHYTYHKPRSPRQPL